MLPGECGAEICANHSHVITLVDEILPQFYLTSGDQERHREDVSGT